MIRSQLFRATALALLAMPAVAQFTAVVPDGYTNVVGNSNNAFPWNRGTASMRFQQVYDSTHFTAQGINFPVLIQEIAFRPWPGATTSWAGGSWPNIQIDMATCPFDYTAVSATFASNLGPDLTTVYNGQVTVDPGSTLGAGVLVPWHIRIPLQTPFIYDPSTGNDFIFDVHLDGTGWTGTSRAVDVVSGAAVNARGSRIYSTAGLATTTGTIGQEHSLVCEFTYVPASGLYASFNANVTSGPSPLTVNFTDSSFSSAPSGVLAWAWDLDGDGITDSTLQNPTFVYTGCGSYNVSLTVIDGINPPSTLTRTAFINTDAIEADFTTQLVGPLVMQFTDTSNMPATSWAWDLDGDGITDSTVQNPVWVYPNTLPVNVTLTVNRLCAPPSTITKPVRAAQELSHNDVPNNGLSSGASVYFDLDVLNPAGLSISSLDVFGSVVNVPFDVEMWVKPGTHVGFEGTAAEWVLSGIASGTSASASTLPSAAAFPQAIYLPPGLHGIKLRYIGTGPRYQNLTATTTIGNADATMTVGVSRGSTLTDPWAGSNIQLRAFSGTLYYGTHNIVGLSGFGQFAPGCNGTLPKSALNGNLPQLGQNFTVNADNLPLSVGIMMVGFSNTASGFGPLPLSLASFGAAGCFGRVNPDATTFLIGASNSASWSFNIPAAPGLSGLIFYQQALVLDAAANAAGFVTSNAAAFQIGN